MNLRTHPRRVLLVVLIYCLSTLGQPALAVQKAPTGTFTFGKADLMLLEQVELFDTRLNKEGLVHDDQELEAYVTRIGESLVGTGFPPERVQWRFRVLRDPLANAFALPNGSIYVHSGLLALLENESQLAAVLAHEITHVRNRHSYLANRSMRKKVLTIHTLALATTWSPANAVGSVIFLASTISQALLTFSVFGYSRELEREADREATNILMESEYDPQELAGSFKLLKKDYDGEESDTPIFYRNHDKLEDRIKHVVQTVTARQPTDRGDLNEQHLRYLAATEKISQLNTHWALSSRRFRTAIALSEKLVQNNPNSSENMRVLADAYRMSGPRPPGIIERELSGKEKKDLRKKRTKMTLAEEEKALLSTSAGQSAWKENQRRAEEYYEKALSLDDANAEAYLGLGLLFEETGRREKAVMALRRFLELRPQSLDRQRVSKRIEAMEKNLSGAQTEN